MKPHVHAELIKQWADGAEIQIYSNEKWVDLGGQPSWFEGSRYRVKPELTDLEKYGVEVGDVWMASFPRKNHLVVQAVLPTKIITCMERLFRKEDLSQLLFRRGVVNKL